jgi:branched-chain amino acid aminotransferase
MPAECLNPEIKSLNYLNNILARIEANRAGADEALMLNLEGNVCEGSVDNIFIVSGGILRTPRLGDGLLAGITRKVILEVASEAGIRCEAVSLRPQDLYAADECFLTGTGAELIPVRQIDRYRLVPPERPVTPEIVRAFQERIASECSAG